jgi:hypothetical protein
MHDNFEYGGSWSGFSLDLELYEKEIWREDGIGYWLRD